MEVTQFVLDVGKLMHPHLELASRAVMDFVEGKMLRKPKDEVSLVFFGTADTRNELNRSYAMTENDPSQYMHVRVEHPLGPPTVDYLKSLRNVPRHLGVVDWVDAVTVALDSLTRSSEKRAALAGARVTRKIILVSNFLSPAKDDPDDIFIPSMIATLDDKGVRLEVLSLDIPQEDEAHLQVKTYNSNLLARIMSESTAHHAIRSLTHAEDLCGAFKAKEYQSTTYYRGNGFTLGPNLTIDVRVSKKTAMEKFPSLAKESPLVPHENGEGPTGAGITNSREYHKVSDPEGPAIPDAEQVKAYRYGGQLVPVDDELEKMLQYSPGMGMWLLGFVDKAMVPRHHYMKDVWAVVAASKGKDNRSHVALSALVQALHRRQQLAIVRFAPREKGGVLVYAGIPMLATANNPDYLLLNALPFYEDIRNFPFPSFETPERTPSEEQLDAARQLVDAMWLGEGPREQLAPEATVNPTLHAFYHLAAVRAVEPGARPTPHDPLVERVLVPRLGELPGAEAALARARTAFPTGPGAKGRGAERGPLDDFQDRLAKGEVGRALEELCVDINFILKRDTQEDFDKAFQCMESLRSASVRYQLPERYNRLYRDAYDRCVKEEGLQSFWRRVADRRLKLIDSREAPVSSVSPDEAEAFLKDHPVPTHR
ncbi:hypothetical protein N2152v2_005701 [Parachlorella kessleri]